MPTYTDIRYSRPVQKIRSLLPHKVINTLRHYPSALAANLFYRYPSKHLNVIGVTGTDGKTTTTSGIFHLFQTAKAKVAMVSTVKAVMGSHEYDTGFHVTTPDPWQLQRLIADIKRQYFKYLVLETTSHGFAQHRLYGIDFDIGVVTNITHEHLDYHGTYEHYWKSKAKLLDHVKIAILNHDDQSFELLKSYLKQHNSRAKIISYGEHPDADVHCTKIDTHSTGIGFTCTFNNRALPQAPKTATFALPILGKYNVHNMMAVIAVGYSSALQSPTTIIKKALKTLPQIPGRMEIMSTKPFTTVVDFAHTPNALDNALASMQEHFIKKQKSRRLISIFGCAGLRDIQKRPLMGEISGKQADITIITAEDPRTENLDDIIEQVAVGCRKAGAKEIKLSQLSKQNFSGPVFIRVPDRGKAIATAITKIAKAGDAIGIFGKGHEQSMCFGTTERPWSDQIEVKKYLQN